MDRPDVERRDRQAALRAAAEADPGRPMCHFRPPAGWMNDPNGTIHHAGHYHLFYQHNSTAAVWGSIHWGHARSRDLVRWEHLPIALEPQRELGEDHCFSGCAWRTPEGRPVLLYSSVRGDARDFRCEQWAVLCDEELERFELWPGNPVVSREAPGQPLLGEKWRDPFVFEAYGRTFMVLAADLPDEGGRPVIPLFESPGDGSPLKWQFRGLLHVAPAAEARYLECPNVVALANRHLLILSPHGPVEYRLGRFDPDGPGLQAEAEGRVDHGTDFYATNLFTGDPGRSPALVGWVRGWSTDRGWNGVLSLPRVLEVGTDGELRQHPLPALSSLRGHEWSRADEWRLENRSELVGLVGVPSLEVDVWLTPVDCARCGLRLRGVRTGRTLVEATISGNGRSVELGGVAFETAWAAGVGGTRRLHLFWDRTVAELFVDGGRDVCTRVMEAAGGEAAEVEVFAEGGVATVQRLDAWELKAIW
ncbi:MAG: glycoside hydrolase family 32 protein [Gemmatimonadetes bacterium]|nr:glycoside hydrolase family 32 protein [Gemmatimonadota bacterium]